MKKKIYNIINIITLVMATLVFIIIYGVDITSFSGCTIKILFVLLITVTIVHSIKAVRLYFELFEQRMPLGIFIRQYCKVIPISMILPFKIGDFFRAFCFGFYLKNHLTGIAVIILDRFVDTVALVTAIIMFSFALGFGLPNIFYALIFFLVLLMITYLACPGMCTYWNKHFIKSKSTKYSLLMLQAVSNIKLAYKDIKTVVSGKFLITYVISIFAWMAEIGGLAFACKLLSIDVMDAVPQYLTGVLVGERTEYLTWFIIISTIMLICLYGMAFIFSKVKGGNES